ncbi:MAG: Monogalactosyldiacylglycerol synthase [Frankiales bacterium]|nr:Monogalactosyldiacylglycerol synthase [Frankiales bacterium]
MVSNRRVTIVSGSVGAGHDGAAYELARRLSHAGVEAKVLDYLSLLPRWLARVLDDGYSNSVKAVPGVFDWIFRRIETSRLVYALAAGVCRLPERRLCRALSGDDAVVTTYPLASRTLGELKRKGLLDLPCLAYLTDPAPHRLWVHTSLDEHLTVTAHTAAEGERLYAVDMTAAGPLVPAQFGHHKAAQSRDRLRDELGLAAGDLAVLISAGSLGLGDIEATAAAVQAAGAVPVVLCGRNESLHRRLTRKGHTALRWRDDVAELMAAVDVLVHNAGGLSLTEALVAGLPAVTFAPIPGHGRANAALLDLTGLAPWAKTPWELRRALHDARHRPRLPLLSPERDASEIVLELFTPRTELPRQDEGARTRVS